MIKPILLTLVFTLSFSSNAQMLGKLKCSWNDNEESCVQNGCLWDASGCLSFSEAGYSSHFSPPDLALSVMRQRLFSIETNFLHRYWVNLGYNDDRWRGSLDQIKFDTLSMIFHWYVSNSYDLIMRDLKKREASDPTFPFAKLARYQQALNFYPLLAPKTTKTTVLYRGLQSSDKSCEEQIKDPKRFISTSWSKDVALKFANWGEHMCLLEIELPEGFPFFGLAGSDTQGREKHGEQEIFLPSHVLDKHGSLVPISFEIVAQRKDGKLTIFTVRPFDVMQPKNASFHDLKDFEKKYVMRICELAPQFGHDTLIKMCAVTKEVMHLSLTSQEDSALHPKITGTYSKYCYDCTLSGSSFSCKCGEHDKETQVDITSCTTKNVYYENGGLHCSLPIPDSVKISDNISALCSNSGTIKCLDQNFYENEARCPSSQKYVETFNMGLWGFGCTEHLPDGPYLKVCKGCRLTNSELQCHCPDMNDFGIPDKMILGAECHDKQVAYKREGRDKTLLCVDKDPLPNGDYSDCGCYVDHDTVRCSCPYKTYNNALRVARESSLTLPCDGHIRIKHRAVVCAHKQGGEL